MQVGILFPQADAKDTGPAGSAGICSGIRMFRRKDMEKQYQYSSPGERFCSEWKIYVLAFVFIVIADSIG